MKKAILLCVLPLSACMTIVSVPVDETLNLVVSGVSELMSSAGSDEEPCTLRHLIRSVCIEYNREVAIPDFVPTVQKRLMQLQVESQLYAPGTVPMNCAATLRYTAVRSWSSHFTSSDLQPYLGEAELTLLQGGHVVALARYQTSRLGYEKWTSVPAKIMPVVDELMCVKKN